MTPFLFTSPPAQLLFFLLKFAFWFKILGCRRVENMELWRQSWLLRSRHSWSCLPLWTFGEAVPPWGWAASWEDTPWTSHTIRVSPKGPRIGLLCKTNYRGSATWTKSCSDTVLLHWGSGKCVRSESLACCHTPGFPFDLKHLLWFSFSSPQIHLQACSQTNLFTIRSAQAPIFYCQSLFPHL